MGRPGDIVERVIALGHRRLPESLALLHPDAEWILGPGQAPIRGRADIRRHMEHEIERLGAALPEAVPLTLIENGDRVVVLGQLRTPRIVDDRRVTEVSPIGFVYDVASEQITRVSVFPSWATARAEASVDPAAPPSRRLGMGWHFVKRRRTGWGTVPLWRLRRSIA
jgi:SnoaL-like domain